MYDYTGGNLEEAESSSVKIVTSPYVIDLSKTKQHFTPGGVFSVVVCDLKHFRASSVMCFPLFWDYSRDGDEH